MPAFNMRGRGRQQQSTNRGIDFSNLLHQIVGAIGAAIQPTSRGRPRGRGSFGARGRGHPQNPGRRSLSHHSKPRRDYLAAGQRGGRGPQRLGRNKPNKTNWAPSTPARRPERPAQGNTTRGEVRNQERSENPDFPKLVKTTNQAARLQHAIGNWESLPIRIETAIDKVNKSIKPPMMDEKLKTKINRATDTFKDNLRRTVNDHLAAKYGQCTRALADLDNTDYNRAKLIAKKQIIRNNNRLTNDTVDALLSTVQADGCCASGSFSLARRRHHANATDQQGTCLPVPTSNRFAVLSEQDNENDDDNEDDNIDIDDIETIREILENDISEETNVNVNQRQNRQYKRKNKSPPSAEPTQGKKTALSRAPEQAGLSDNCFLTPIGTKRGKGAPRTGSEHPVAPITIEVDVHHPDTTPDTTPMPSPASVASSLPSGYLHLSVFDAKKRTVWELPEIMDGEDTVVLADSNGVALARHSPPNWRIVAFRGAVVQDINRILEKCPIPTHVRRIIIFVGTNDRFQPNQPFVNSVCRLKELLSLQTRAVHVVAIPTIEDTPSHLVTTTESFNKWFQDMFEEAGMFIPLPADFVARRVRRSDVRHFHTDSAEAIIQHIIGNCSTLN